MHKDPNRTSYAVYESGIDNGDGGKEMDRTGRQADGPLV
jgi:hypothetical protein